MYYEANKDTLPFCCGVQVIGDCENDATEDVTAAQAITQQMPNSGLALYTTIDAQKDVIEALEELGFDALTRFNNPNTGNNITLWGLVITKPRGRKR